MSAVGIFRDYVGAFGPFWKCKDCGRRSKERERICPTCGDIDSSVAIVARVVGRRKLLGIPIGVLEVEERQHAR